MQALSLAQPLVGVARGAAMGGGRFSQRALSARAAVAPRGPVSLLSNHTAAGVLSLQRVSQVTLLPCAASACTCRPALHINRFAVYARP